MTYYVIHPWMLIMSAIDCQRREVARYAIISRIAILFAMSISCKLLPNFHPGDDVLQFDMRLIPQQPDEKERTCYCLQGHSCDIEWISRRRIDNSSSISCADNKDKSSTSTRYVWLDRFYAFILPPVTKWDGARFLSLSVDPWARYPHMISTKDDIDQTETDQTCNDSNEDTTTTCTNNEDYNNESQFASSEQAHAFFPLLPLSIRYTANLMLKVIPASILPPTYEATAALSVIIINMLAFLFASISLYDLTIFILKRQASENDSNKPTTTQNTSKQPNKTILDEETHYVYIAKNAAQLFCINPAGVFFTAAYSESIFAMLTFAGHTIAAKGQYCQSYLDKRKGGDMIIRDLKSRSYVISCLLWANLYWIPSTILWMLASFTRSNGTFSSTWWILVGVAKCCSYIKLNKGKDITANIEKVASLLLFYGTIATFVALPVLYHDLQGYNNHCSGMSIMPSWCKQEKRFSLYAHVQRKHWNVGLFRYFELKQIPNFILALPVLILSFTAAGLWIKHSWNRHAKGRIRRRVQDVFRWAYLALSASSSDYQKQKEVESNNNMLLGPKFLSYYAILFGFALVGTFLAHVQISTRLICSSCPALYWFVAHLMLSDNRSDDKRKRERLRVLIYFYFALYNILGAVMHVNWLPWT